MREGGRKEDPLERFGNRDVLRVRCKAGDVRAAPEAGPGCERGGHVLLSGSLKICLVAKSLENDAVGSAGLLWPREQASWGIAMEISSF